MNIEKRFLMSENNKLKVPSLGNVFNKIKGLKNQKAEVDLKNISNEQNGSSLITEIEFKKRKIQVFVDFEIEIVKNKCKEKNIITKEIIKENKNKKLSLVFENKQIKEGVRKEGFFFIPLTVSLPIKTDQNIISPQKIFKTRKNENKKIIKNFIDISLNENSKKISNYWNKITKNIGNIFVKSRFKNNTIILTEKINFSEKEIPGKTPFN